MFVWFATEIEFLRFVSVGGYAGHKTHASVTKPLAVSTADQTFDPILLVPAKGDLHNFPSFNEENTLCLSNSV